MRKFIYRLIAFITIIFIIGLIKLAFSPNSNYSYPFLNAKLEFLKKHPEFNTYFLGSSKINDQIDCKTIDKNLQGIKSYNLGANAGFDLENFQTLDYILDNSDFKPKYIVLELQDKIKVTKTNFKTERSFGAFNFENTAFAIKYHTYDNNYKQIALSACSFFLNVFHFSKKLDERTVQSVSNKFIENNQGFSPLDLSSVPRTEEKSLRKVIKDRLERYQNDHNLYKPNLVLTEKINQLAERCKEKGIKLIVIIPGPAEPDAKKLGAYKNVLKVPVISIYDPETNPEFYQYEYRWDYGHLNLKGSEILSKKVASEMKEIYK